MARQRQTTHIWQLLTVAALASLSGGAFCSAVAQGPDFDTKIARVNRSPNPKVNLNRVTAARPGNRSAKLSPEEAKRQAIEQAIKDGNETRDYNDYERALASYRKVSEELNPRCSQIGCGLLSHRIQLVLFEDVAAQSI